MADTSILGELLVLITGDTSKYDKGLTESQKKTEKFQASMTKFGKNLSKNVTLPIIGVGAGLVKLVSSIGQSADKLLDLEQITGLSTTTLQEFKNVATVAGVSFEGLTGIVQKFSSRLPTIEAGTSETAIAFKQLGVDLRDASGEIRSTEEIVPELISSLQSIENVTERNSIAQQVFGKSLGDLAPVLGMTAEQTKAARDEAHELGLVWDNESIQLANEFRVESEKLTTQFKQQGVELGTSLIPVFQEALPAVRDLLDNIVEGVTTFSNLSGGTKKLIFGIAGVAAATGPAITGITKLNKAFTILSLPKGGLTLTLVAIAAIVAGIKTINSAVKESEEIKSRLDRITNGTASYADKLAVVNIELEKEKERALELRETYNTNRGKAAENARAELLETEVKINGIRNTIKAIEDERDEKQKAIEDQIKKEQELANIEEEKRINAEEAHQAKIQAYVDQNNLVEEVLSSEKSEIELIKEKIAEINKLSLADGTLKENQLKATKLLQSQIDTIEADERAQREADYKERLSNENAINNEIYEIEKAAAEKRAEVAKELTEEKKELAENIISTFMDVASAIVEIGNNQADQEISILENELEKELEINETKLQDAISKNDEELASALELSNSKLALKLAELETLTQAEQDLVNFKNELAAQELEQSILDDEAEIARLLSTGEIEDAEEARKLQRDLDNAAKLRELEEKATADELQRIADVAAATKAANEETAKLEADAAAESLRLEEESAAEKKRIENEKALAIWRIEKQQFEASKNLAKAEIVVNTAIGASKAWAQTGLFGGLAGAAIVTAGGLAQLAIVESEPAPARLQLNTGAVVSGSRRGVDVTVGENNQGEIIQGMGSQGRGLRKQLANETADVILSRMGGGTNQTININGSGIWTKRDLDEFAIKIRPSTVRANQRVGA